MKALIVSCSLNPDSRSAALAQHAAAAMTALGAQTQALDLRELTLPLCDAGPAYAAPDAVLVRQAIEEAQAILLAVPIYNFDVSAATKNLVELTGKAWSGKVVGFMCAAGGRGSYMSVMSLANSLMLDFRCIIVPRFVYTVGEDYHGDGSSKPQTDERVTELCTDLHRIATALCTEVVAPRDSRPLMS